MLDLEQYTHDIRQTETVEQAFAVLNDYTRQLGFDRTLYSLMTDLHSIALPAGHAVLGSYPTEWMQYYFRQNYEDIDPVRKAVMLTNEPFRWTDMHRMVQMGRQEQRILGEAEDALVRDGVGLGLHCPNGEVVGMGFASSDRAELTPFTLSLLRFLAMEFHSRFVQLHAHRLRTADNPLTRRESEVLMWMARGKTAREIAAILSIQCAVSQNTIKFHQKNIYEKLDASNQTNAIMKAFFRGILTRADLNNYI